jgi:hypothetical protein
VRGEHVFVRFGAAQQRRLIRVGGGDLQERLQLRQPIAQ